jgi:pimeloyl-ACP methyl ester carboxylesterase
MPFLRVRDVRLHYELDGPSGPAAPSPPRVPLVLLHGLGSSTRDWQPQVKHFSQKRRVLALDLRGHGRSSKPPGPYAISLFAGDVADAALRVLSVRRIGWLLGRRLFPDRPDLQREMTARWAQNDPAVYRASFEAIVDWSARARLPEISTPTLVAAAEEDYLPLSAYRAYAGRIPRAEVAVLENARHAAPVAQPEAFNAVLSAFLERF